MGKDIARAIHNLGPEKDDQLDRAFDLVEKLLTGLDLRISIFELIAHPFVKDEIEKRNVQIQMHGAKDATIVGIAQLEGDYKELPKIAVKAGTKGLLSDIDASTATTIV